MTNNQNSAREAAERIVDRLQDFLHVATGPNEDGTHSGFLIVDYGAADDVLGEDAPGDGAIALLPFNLSESDDPSEVTTADDEETAVERAEEILDGLLDLVEGIIVRELEG
jgi:hypothetical protein